MGSPLSLKFEVFSFQWPEKSLAISHSFIDERIEVAWSCSGLASERANLIHVHRHAGLHLLGQWNMTKAQLPVSAIDAETNIIGGSILSIRNLSLTTG